MHIGTALITLSLAEGFSLKDKRQVVKSLIETARHKFNAAVSEVGSLDAWRRAEVGVAVVSNDSAHCNSMLDKIVDYFESDPRVEVSEVEITVD
jgi:uncharacterized protein YlxP (DUF503 family)